VFAVLCGIDSKETGPAAAENRFQRGWSTDWPREAEQGPHTSDVATGSHHGKNAQIIVDGTAGGHEQYKRTGHGVASTGGRIWGRDMNRWRARGVLTQTRAA